MDAQAHGQFHTPLPHEAGIESSHGLYDPQPGSHRPLRVVFVRQRVAEIDEQAIAEILSDMALIAGHHLGAGRLIGAHHLAPLLGVQSRCEGSRVDEITEQHGELATFGLGGTRLS
jgi:hypothetical protein